MLNEVCRVLKVFGVELSSYHSGSLNGKDIKKVMNNATHIFDQFAAISKEGKRRRSASWRTLISIWSVSILGGLCFVGRSIFISKNN